MELEYSKVYLILKFIIFLLLPCEKKKNLNVNNGTKTFLKKWKITPTFFIKHYLRGGKFVENKIISQKYIGPVKEVNKNFIYFFDLLKCKIKLLLSYVQ